MNTPSKLIKTSVIALAAAGFLGLSASLYAARVSLSVESITKVTAGDMSFTTPLTQENLQSGGLATSLESFTAYTTNLHNPNITFTLASPETDSNGPYLSIPDIQNSAKINYKVEITPCGAGTTATDYQPTTSAGTTITTPSVSQQICNANAGSIRVILLPTTPDEAIASGQYEGTLNLTVSGT